MHRCSWQESLGDFHGRNSLYGEIHQRTASDQNGGRKGYRAATWTKQCLKPHGSYPRGLTITEGWKTWLTVVAKRLLKTAFKDSLADTIWEKALWGFQTRELDVCAEQISRSYNKGKNQLACSHISLLGKSHHGFYKGMLCLTVLLWRSQQACEQWPMWISKRLSKGLSPTVLKEI